MDTLLFLNYASSNGSTVEIFLRNFSFATLFISMLFYWIQTAFSTKINYGYGDSKNKITPKVLIKKKKYGEAVIPLLEQKKTSELYLYPPVVANVVGTGVRAKFQIVLNFFSYLKMVFGLLKKKTLFSLFNAAKENFGNSTMIISNFLLLFLLIFRWTESGHFPLSNLYESLMFLSWSCTSIHLILEFKTEKVRREANLLTKLIGSITSPSAFFTNAFATFSLSPEMQKASPLVPALQSNWLMMHVTVMIISYSALILGSLLSIAFLILTSSNPFSSTLTPLLPSRPLLRNPLLVSLSPSLDNGGSEMGSSTHATYVGNFPLQGSHNEGMPRRKGNETLSNLAWNFDNLSYRVIGIGFPFLTIGILSGAVWANEAWGSYWSWDPKETWALLTWLIFAIYLHARITKGWQGKKPALIASFGFLAIWVCFLGVNLIGEGLHSYGWF